MKQNLPNRNRSGEGTDERIRRALTRRAETVRVSSQDSRRMIGSVARKIEEENRMRKWSAKKIVVVAAAVCVFGTITAVAAGKIVGIASHSNWNDAVYQYSQVADVEQEIGFEAKIPETFTNGYGFSSALPGGQESRDADGNTVESVRDISVNYKKGGMADIQLIAAPSRLSDTPLAGDSTFTHGETTLYFSVTENLFVPPDYQVSEEEQALADAGKLNIGYGSPEVERTKSQTVYWEDGGVFYTMISFDNTMTAEEFAGMAGEIIDLK